jgi:hypothetical protein
MAVAHGQHRDAMQLQGRAEEQPVRLSDLIFNGTFSDKFIGMCKEGTSCLCLY